MELDSFDREILIILQRDNTTPQRVIGEAVNLSAAAVQRRIRKLEAHGVVKANTAVVEPELVGRTITVVVEVELHSEDSQLIDGAKQRFLEEVEIQQCYYVTGDADFMLVLTVTSMAEYERFTRRMFFDDSNVKRFKTFIVMDRVKSGMQVPL